MMRSTLLTALLLWTAAVPAVGQPVMEPFRRSPFPFAEGSVRYSIGAELTLLPRQIVEEEIRQIPLVTFNARYGLPEGLSLTAGFSTVYITNVVSAGLRWSVPLGPAAFSLGQRFAFWFGVADMEGFDTRSMGLFALPGFSAGVRTGDQYISVENELIIMLSQHTYFGEASVGRVKPEILGFTSAVVLEQPLGAGTGLSIAAKMNYAVPNYQVWLAFSVQDRWLIFPELQAEVLL